MDILAEKICKPKDLISVALVSVRLVEAENLDWPLLWVSEVIREILPFIRARFPFRLCHSNFPTHINSLHTTAF